MAKFKEIGRPRRASTEEEVKRLVTRKNTEWEKHVRTSQNIQQVQKTP